MVSKTEEILNKKQLTSLQVLGYLFFRMGLWDKAERTYSAIVALSPKEKPCSISHAALAAIALERNDGKKAMQFLHIALQHIPISSRNATFHLMRAKALWIEKRNDEANQAIEEYLYLVADKSTI